MSDRHIPRIYLKQNPWPDTLGNGVLMMLLNTAAVQVEETIKSWIAEGAVDDPDAAYAAVILDPTNPREQRNIHDRIMTVMLFGDREKAKHRCLPCAAAKADVADRHRHTGMSNGEIIEESNFLLDDKDFAWGDSAEFDDAIAAGSGLSAAQDCLLAHDLLEVVMTRVHTERDRWIRERRRQGSHGWYNADDKPAKQYQNILESADWITLAS